jgi:hypothetical protein
MYNNIFHFTETAHKIGKIGPLAKEGQIKRFNSHRIAIVCHVGLKAG